MRFVLVPSIAAGRLLLVSAGSAAALAVGPLAPAAAQTATPVQPASDQPARAPRPAPADDEQSTEAPRVSEVVVTGKRRPQPGAVVGDIKPELQLGPADIRSYGVSTVTELLNELSPEIRSDRGRGGEAAVVLLNGRRISGLNEVRDIPVEAILRVDILPEEVALKYGYSANQRVVNIVLRRRFRAVTGELTGGGPTEGGEVTGQVEADLLQIRGDNRLNLDFKYAANTALGESARNITSVASGRAFDLVGNVTGALPGSEIDPALSALVGRPVTVVGVPAAGASRTLIPGDFAAGGGLPNVTDLRPYRTLLPAAQSVSANGVLARAFGNGVRATVNATLGATSSDAREGLPGLGLLVPAGDPFSPFQVPVTVDRYVDAFGPLKQSSSGWTAHLGSTLNKDVGDWRLSLTGAYDYGHAETDSDVGVDGRQLQGLLNALSPAFNPFGPLLSTSLVPLPRDVAVSDGHSGNVQLLANGPLASLPAGELYGSFKVGDTLSLQDSSSTRSGLVQAVRLSRNDVNAQVNIDLPLASASRRVFGLVGDLSLNVNAAVDDLSDFGVLKTYGYGVNWTPVSGVNLIVSHTHDEAAPSQQQLGAPPVLTPGVRLFDYATGQTVDVTRIGGGTSGLVSDSREVTKIGLTWKPVPGQDLTLTANYVDSRITNPVETFPAATSHIEAAFSSRFVRDASGELTQVDFRPVNFSSEDRREIRYGLNYSRPIGAQPAPRVPRREREGDGERGGGDRGGDRGEGGGRGGGGYGGGGRGGGVNGPAAGRLQLAVYHTIYFKDQMLVRPGGPLLDLLNGSAAGNGGGQPVHEVEVQAGYTLHGLGARLSADWRSGTTVVGAPGGSTGNLSFSDLGTANLRLFANLGQMRTVVARYPILRGSRVTLSIVNLLDTRQTVRDAQGNTPVSYQPAYLDPAGRTIRLSVRKLFY